MSLTRWLDSLLARGRFTRAPSRFRHRRQRQREWYRVAAPVERLEDHTLLATLVVTTTADTVADDGELSLREAIIDSNERSGPDTIVFNIPTSDPGFIDVDSGTSGGDPDSDVFLIQLDSELPAFTEAGTVIDGSSQATFTGTTNPVGPEIIMDGRNSVANGLTIRSNDNDLIGIGVHGFTNNGIDIEGDNNRLQGNYIGTDATGSMSLGNGESGVRVASDADENVIGGTEPAAENVISANGLHGVYLIRAGVAGNHAVGNLIGTDSEGEAALGNRGNGVSIDFSPNNHIGGTEAGARNLISGNNGSGIAGWGADTTGNVIQGNDIGTDITGTTALGNASAGIHVSGAFDNLIGGTDAGAGNIIAFNNSSGVQVGVDASDPAQGNAISGNAIHSNSGLGIDLGPDGVTPNDRLDADDGPNTFQNFPVLVSAISTGSTIEVEGTLDSTPSTELRLEFFANDSIDSTDHGEGASFLGAADAVTDADGNASFTVKLDASVTPGTFFTATATDPQNNTSEFSAAIEVAALGTAISIGDVANGEIETPGVEDHWQLEVAENQAIFLDVQQITGTKPGTQWLDFKLQAPDGTTVFTSTGHSASKGADWADTGPLLLPEAGTYTLIVDGQDDDTVTYQFQVFDVPSVWGT